MHDTLKTILPVRRLHCSPHGRFVQQLYLRVAQSLEKELANFGKEKDKHIKAAQAKAKKARADTEAAKAALKAAAAALAEAAAERDAAGDERTSLEAQLAAAQKVVTGEAWRTHQGWNCFLNWASCSFVPICGSFLLPLCAIYMHIRYTKAKLKQDALPDVELEAVVAKKDAEVAAASGKLEEASRQLQERKDALLEFDQDISKLAKQKAKLEEEATDASVTRKRKENE